MQHSPPRTVRIARTNCEHVIRSRRHRVLRLDTATVGPPRDRLNVTRLWGASGALSRTAAGTAAAGADDARAKRLWRNLCVAAVPIHCACCTCAGIGRLHAVASNAEPVIWRCARHGGGRLPRKAGSLPRGLPQGTRPCASVQKSLATGQARSLQNIRSSDRGDH